MIIEFWEFLVNIIYSAINMLNSASVWMVVSFGIAGIVHEYMSPEKMRKSSVGSTKISGVLWTTLAGTGVPICSCGSTPLGISLYYSGAYLGPTLAFMTSTPVLNPVAIILTWGLLGKEVAIINIITGL
ncbi:MAG TPA: permease, partial [Clostridia bacterium]|nr:permease [Clostridia bacterium]